MEVYPIKVEEEIKKILKELGIPTSSKGYLYLADAIALTVDRFEAAEEGIYTALAEKHHTTEQSVASAITRAINKMADYGDIDLINSYFGNTVWNKRGKPTAGEFITMMADHVKMKAENDPLKLRLTKIMHTLGIPADLKGYHYLRDLLLLAVADPDGIDSAVSSVAEAYGTTDAAVKTAIGKAIDLSWERGDAYLLHAYFGYTVYDSLKKPSLHEFVSVIVAEME